MLEEMGPAWTASDRERRKISQSLANIAVFDCTLDEARLAANAGCKFCLAITNKDRHAQIADENKSDAGPFLAGQPSKGIFGVLSWSGRFWCFQVTDRVDTFEILALSGKLAFPSKYLLFWA
jgi:hypothetical protein